MKNPPYEMRVAWGDKLKARREALGLTMKEMAEHIGATRQCVGQIEQGKFFSTPPALKDMLAALGYPRTTPDTLDVDSPGLPEWIAARGSADKPAARRKRDKDSPQR